MHLSPQFLLSRPSSRRSSSDPVDASSQRQAEGFTLVEVLVGMMLSLIFMSISMHIFVSSAFLRSQSTKYNDAYNWVQEDFEQVLSKAQTFQLNATPYPSQCDATTANAGLAASFLGDGTNGLGGTSVNLGQRTFGGATFVLTRTGDYNSTRDPYRLLNVNYTVTPVGGGASILDLDTKVLIYSSFNCPS